MIQNCHGWAECGAICLPSVYGSSFQRNRKNSKNKSNHETNALDCVSPHWTLFAQKVRKNEMYDAYTKCMRFVVDAAAALVYLPHTVYHTNNVPKRIE